MILELNTRLMQPDITVFEFVGKLTLGNALLDAERTVQKAIQNGSRKIVLDLSQLSIIDSAGIGLLVFCTSEMEKAHGKLSIAGPNSKVSNIFDVTHLQRVISVFPDVDAACAGFASATAAGN